MTDLVHVAALPDAAAEHPAMAAGRATAEQVLRGALTVLDELLAAHPDDVAGNGRTYALVTRIRSDLAALADRAATNLAEHMTARRWTLEGVGTFEQHRDTRTVWDDDSCWTYIAHAAAARFAVDEDGHTADGATLNLVEAAIDTVVAEARALRSPGSWRKTAFRDRGVDLDLVCTSTYGRHTVQLTPIQGDIR